MGEEWLKRFFFLHFFFSNPRRKAERQPRSREVVRLRREHLDEVDLEVADARGPDEAGALSSSL